MSDADTKQAKVRFEKIVYAEVIPVHAVWNTGGVIAPPPEKTREVGLYTDIKDANMMAEACFSTKVVPAHVLRILMNDGITHSFHLHSLDQVVLNPGVTERIEALKARALAKLTALEKSVLGLTQV